MRQQVVRKAKITPVLLEGGSIRYTHWDAKPELFDSQGNLIGTIRFDTYLQLDLREIEMKLPLLNTDYSINEDASPFYRLKRVDAWQGYDTFKLKEKALEMAKHSSEYMEYLKERMWR